jgi:O-acetyl-ADP-ribose deacetylase (regulator of RNase III)
MATNIMTYKINNTEIEVIKGDITLLDIEAIVNPANNYLIHGGGLAAAIVRRGGQIIQQESKKIGNVPTGSAVYTSGGHLKAEFVIHAVGPRYKDGKQGEQEKLASAVKSALDIADKKKLKSVALPAISSGIFGYPIAACAEIIVKAIGEFLSGLNETTLEKVVICLIDDTSFNEFEKQMKNLPAQKSKAVPKKEDKAKEEKTDGKKITEEKHKAKTTKAKTTRTKTTKTKTTKAMPKTTAYKTGSSAKKKTP